MRLGQAERWRGSGGDGGVLVSAGHSRASVAAARIASSLSGDAAETPAEWAARAPDDPAGTRRWLDEMPPSCHAEAAGCDDDSATPAIPNPSAPVTQKEFASLVGGLKTALPRREARLVNALLILSRAKAERIAHLEDTVAALSGRIACLEDAATEPKAAAR